MVCVLVRAIMYSLTLVHYRYVHAHNHAITKTYGKLYTVFDTNANSKSIG